LGPIYSLQKHLLSVLVWDVLDHNGCAIIKAVQNVVNVQSKLHFSHSLSITLIIMPRFLFISNHSLLWLIEVNHHEVVMNWAARGCLLELLLILLLEKNERLDLVADNLKFPRLSG